MEGQDGFPGLHNPYLPAQADFNGYPYAGHYTAVNNYPPPTPPTYDPSTLVWTFPGPYYLAGSQRALAVLNVLQDMNMSVTNLLLDYVLGNDERLASFKNGFYNSNSIPHLLNKIFANKRGKAALLSWISQNGVALDLVTKDVEKEMDVLKVKFKKNLASITPEDLVGFDVKKCILEDVKDDSPVLSHILLAAARTERAAKENTTKNPELAQLARSRSKTSALFQIVLTFVLHIGGLSRTAVELLSQCGLCISYPSLWGVQKSISDCLILRASEFAATNPHSFCWDNTQVLSSIYTQQRAMGPSKVTTGGTAIIYELFFGDATEDACKLAPILESRKTFKNGLIQFNEDIRPTKQQEEDFTSHQIVNILTILFENHTRFSEYAKRPDLGAEFRHKQHRPPPKAYKTRQFVMRPRPIDQSSTNGNVKFVIDVYTSPDQLALDPEIMDGRAVPTFNDQATNAHVRSAQGGGRVHDLNDLYRMSIFQVAIGFFHVSLNLLWHLLRVHRGTIKDLGSIQYYIALLHRTRLDSKHPDFYALRSLCSQILVGNILACWTQECGFKTLDEFADSNPSPETLLGIARTIYRKYASSVGLQSCARASEYNSKVYRDSDADTTEDTTFRNTILLNRDLLFFYELESGISSGDFGRLENILGLLTMMFTGAGASNYSNEFLHFIQNMKKVWPKEFVDVVCRNSLTNHSGLDGHWMGADLNIEHVNKYEKDYCIASGIQGDPWTRLAATAPAIPVLHPLQRNFSKQFGGAWRGITHTEPDCSNELWMVVQKANELELLQYKRGRESTSRTTDILERGREQLKSKGLAAFSKRYIGYVNSTSGGFVDPSEVEGLEVEADEHEGPQMSLEELLDNVRM